MTDKPSIAEIDILLNSEDTRNVRVTSDGRVISWEAGSEAVLAEPFWVVVQNELKPMSRPFSTRQEAVSEAERLAEMNSFPHRQSVFYVLEAVSASRRLPLTVEFSCGSR